LPERSAAAAAGQAADRYDRQAVAAGGPVYLPAGTDGAPGGLTNDLAAGDDDSVAACARTRDANASDDPRAVELLPPPPPLLRDARRGSSVSDVPRRAGFEDSTERGASREPESDFSSLPMLPPALPDCASAAADPNAADMSRESTAILIERSAACFIINCFQYLERKFIGRTHRHKPRR
jgi:hypothetical protein